MANECSTVETNAGQLGLESGRPGPVLSLLLACWGMCLIENFCSTKVGEKGNNLPLFHFILYPNTLSREVPH